jgi:hypothetical protein
MSSRRRNSITERDLPYVWAVVGTSAVLAVFAGCRPTGEAVPDVLLTAAFAAAVTWAAASAPWWALVVAPGLAAVATTAAPLLVAVALVAVACGGALGVWRNSLPPVRAACGAITVQVALRLTWDPNFLAAGLVAAAATGLLVVTGLQRRSRTVRRRARRAAIAAGGFVLVALLALSLAGRWARSDATDGYDDLLEGLAHVRSGDPIAAADSLQRAAEHLRAAHRAWTGPLSQPARLVPVLAQNRTALADVCVPAADAAEAAARTLRLIDLDQLRVVAGVIDVEVLALLEQPLADLERTAADLATALGDAETAWLLPPFQSRLATVQQLAADVAGEARTTSAAARVGPAMLGADGPRRYLIGFTSPAEARGTSGLMGNWAEITVDGGALHLSATGRANDLISGLVERGGGRIEVGGDIDGQYFDRYGRFGAGEVGGTVAPKYWSNITMSPHMPSVGSAMTQLYAQATGRTVDGVILIDPAGLAALLDLTGPVSVPDLDIRLTSTTIEQYLLVDQYKRPEAEREDVLEAVTDATIRRVLSATLPNPTALAAELGPVAVGGHLSMWAARSDEQELITLTGSDGSLPDLFGRDGLAVIDDNASGNKIDTFLDRTTTYRAAVDERTGHVTATLTVTLDNRAPTTGLPDYVIGNLVGLPAGTNRTLLSVYTPLEFTAVTLDGRPVGLAAGTEQGWNVYSILVDIPAGERRTLQVTLDGMVSAGEYELVVRPQPLARPERLSVEVHNQRGSTVAGFVGTLERRSVVSSDGLEPLR